MKTKIKNFMQGMVLGMLAFTLTIPFTSAVPTRDVVLDTKVKSFADGSVQDEIKPVGTKYVLKQNDEIAVDILLLNPSQQKIISTETWLSYDPKKFTGVKIDNTDSPFDLITPGENEFVPEQSLVRIGRGNTSGGVDSTTVKVATVFFKVISAKPGDVTEMKFYDFQPNEMGHTNVNVMSGGLPFNVISSKEPNKISFVINSQYVAPIQGSGSVLPVQGTTNTSSVLYPSSGVLPVPQNVRVSTDTSSITLSWDPQFDARVKSYYIYYTTHQNLYLHRKKVYGTSYTFSNLLEGDRYYFVITSADARDYESGYSAETSITVGQNGTVSYSTALSAASLESLRKLSKTAGTGPTENYILILLVSSLVYPGYKLLNKKKHNSRLTIGH